MIVGGKRMKRIQISHNIVDKELLKEVKKYMVAPWQKYLLIFTACIAFVLCVINFVHQETMQAVIFLVLILVCIGEMFFLMHSHYKEMLKLMEEAGNEDQMTYTMSFGQDYVVVHNCQTAKDHKIPYRHLKALSESAHAYILMAKKNDMIIIRKDCLKVGLHDFVTFLKSKDTKIKRWLKA